MLDAPEQPPSPVTLRENLRQAFDAISNANLREGFSKLMEFGGRGFRGALVFILDNVGVKALRQNMPLRYKILPAIAVALVSTFTVLAGVVTLVGLSTLVPPFTMVASALGLVSSIADYFQYRAERNKLRKDCITTKTFKALIANEELSIPEIDTLKNTIQAPIDLYQALYSLRNDLIDLPIEIHLRNQLLSGINAHIEKVHEGEVSELLLDSFEQLPEEYHFLLREHIARINACVFRYKDAALKQQGLSLSLKLQQALDQYQLLQAKVYSSDLPLSLKQKIMTKLQKEKLSKKTIYKLSYAMADHYMRMQKREVPAVNPHFEIINYDPFKGVSKRIKRLFSRQESLYAAKAFSTQYKPVFDVLRKKERLRFLERSTKQLLINIGLCTGGAVFGIAATAIGAAAAVGAAPIMVVGTVFSTIGLVFSVGSLVSAINLNRVEKRSNKKLKKPKREVKEIIHEEIVSMSSAPRQGTILHHTQENVSSSALPQTPPSQDLPEPPPASDRKNTRKPS